MLLQGLKCYGKEGLAEKIIAEGGSPVTCTESKIGNHGNSDLSI